MFQQGIKYVFDALCVLRLEETLAHTGIAVDYVKMRVVLAQLSQHVLGLKEWSLHSSKSYF